MLDFKKIKLEDIPMVRPYLDYVTNRFCDITIGGIFIWRDMYNMEYAIFRDTLVIKGHAREEMPYFYMPLGAHPQEAIEQMQLWCAEQGVELLLGVLSESDLEMLPDREQWEVTRTAIWDDYLYPAEQLATLKGRHLSGQRNHINYFTKNWPEHHFERITQDNLPAVRELVERYSAVVEKESPLFREDIKKNVEVIEHFDEYGFPGVCLVADGRVIAFAMGEVVGDTLHVHIEKADRTYRGAYPMIVREFSRIFAAEGVQYINREDDSGDEGLRASKLSYHPCALLKKYNAVWQPGRKDAVAPRSPR